MAEAHIKIDPNTEYGRQVRRALQLLREGKDLLNDVLDIVAQMRDGDGSQAAHYAYATPFFGTTSDAKTKAMADELSSLAFKLNTNSSVSDVHAAMEQAFAKLG